MYIYFYHQKYISWKPLLKLNRNGTRYECNKNITIILYSYQKGLVESTLIKFSVCKIKNLEHLFIKCLTLLKGWFPARRVASRVSVGVKSNFSPANARPPALAQGWVSAKIVTSQARILKLELLMCECDGMRTLWFTLYCTFLIVFWSN